MTLDRRGFLAKRHRFRLRPRANPPAPGIVEAFGETAAYRR
jgi:hypothetical protein